MTPDGDRREDGAAGPRRSRAAITPHIPEMFLAMGVIASGILLLHQTAGITFVTDEWDLLLLRPGWGFDQILDPFNEHTIMAPAFIYKVIQAVFGMESHRPFQVIAVGTFLLSAVLFFVYVRRRVGPWAALIMTFLILFLGGAFEDLVWAFQIGYFGSLAAGLGALIALDRDDRKGDFRASVLLVVSLTFSSLAIPFIAAAAAEWLLNPRDRDRRWFVPGAAVIFYALWWLGWGRTAESQFDLSNLPDLPGYVFTAISAGFTTIAGLATGDGSEPDQPHLIWGRIFFVVTFGLAAWHLVRRRSVSRGLLVILVLGLTFYVLAGLNQDATRAPESSRFQLPSAVFILLAAAWLLEGVRIRVPALAVAAVLGGLAIWGGLNLMNDEVDARWTPTSKSLRASLGAIDVAGESARPDYSLVVGLKVPVPLENYLDATRDFGSPGLSTAEIGEADPGTRATADSTLFDTLGLQLSGDTDGVVGSECIRVRSGTSVEVGPGIAIIRNHSDADLGIGLSRFSDIPGLELGAILPRSFAALSLPRDRSSLPWQIGITRGGPASVCRGD